MNRILLACIALALPSFVAAAPCNILPYANQCQGSNLWPVPAGWTADNDGDCQPQPPSWVYTPPGTQYYAAGQTQPSLSSLFSAVTAAVPSSLGVIVEPGGSHGVALYTGMPCTYRTSHGRYYGAIIYNGYLVTPSFCNGDVSGQIWGSEEHVQRVSTCPTGWSLFENGVATGRPEEVLVYRWSYDVNSAFATWHVCRQAGTLSTMKPADGVCTARWTSSAQTALQKDPLDPDCDANSCVFDGTCKLR